MLGSLFQLHDIDGVIVGADRIVSNGDTANKVGLSSGMPVTADIVQIGTYQAAVLAQRHNIPFMVVAPVTTVDRSMQSGKE
jgi:methylthioribose-1-phosphate isomerase